MSEHILAITTVTDEESAAKLARALVEARLVACVNILPGARSIYRYEGAIEDERECVLLMKTRRERYEALAAEIKESHPYDVPELIALSIEAGSAPYLSWLDDNVG